VASVLEELLVVSVLEELPVASVLEELPVASVLEELPVASVLEELPVAYAKAAELEQLVLMVQGLFEPELVQVQPVARVQAHAAEALVHAVWAPELTVSVVQERAVEAPTGVVAMMAHYYVLALAMDADLFDLQ